MAADSAMLIVERLRERPCRPIPIPATGASHTLTSRPALLVGWSLRESTGAAAASVEFLSGTSANSGIAGEQQLAQGVSASQTIADEGCLCEGGIYLSVISGSVVGCVWARV